MRGKPTHARRPRAGRLVAGVVAGLLVGWLLPASAPADEAEAVPALDPRSAPVVPLDRLFELPTGFEPRAAERRGGVGEAGWRTRFAEARTLLANSELSLAKSKLELAELAESNGGWGVAPPVPGMKAGPNEGPMNYSLSQRIKRHESELDDAKRRLVDLEVSANLANVPEDWRR